MFYLIYWYGKIERIIEILLIIRFIFSFMGYVDFLEEVRKIVYSLTDPLLQPFRHILKLGNMYLDLSPILLIIVLRLIRYVLISLYTIF